MNLYLWKYYFGRTGHLFEHHFTPLVQDTRFTNVKKLLILATVGDPKSLRLAVKTRATFPADWHCLVLSYNASVVGDAFHSCRVVTQPGRWGHLVRNAVPFTKEYDYVALVLDDLSVSISPDTLVETLRRYDGSVISPGIREATHMVFWNKNCLYETPFIEIYYMIFDQTAWLCFASLFDAFPPDYDGLSGWGLDLCMQQHCKFRMLYDNRISANHHAYLRPKKGDTTQASSDVQTLNTFVSKTAAHEECFTVEDVPHMFKRSTCLQK